MRRVLAYSVPALVLLVAGLVWAQPRQDKQKSSAPSARSSEVDRLLEEYDKNKDGFLQRDELPPRLRHYFEQIDTNRDGKLSREELEQGLVYLQQRRRPSDVVFVLVEMSDCDEDCCCEVQQLYDMLRKLDKNHDGKIDADELKAARKQLLEERIGHIFEELDADKDGKISRQEARGRIKEHFDQIDTNKDGFIDRDELMRAASEKTSGSHGKSQGGASKSKGPERPREDK
jgi:Ca2+-binding EF-hand superfamily protein